MCLNSQNLQLNADLFIIVECRQTWVIFCFEREITSLYIKTVQCLIQEILIYLLTACNNYSTCFYMN